MTHSVRDQSKYGLPKNIVVRSATPHLSQDAEIWQRTRDEFAALLLDAMDALQAHVIDRRQYDREKARLSAAMWRADQSYQNYARAADRRRRR